MGGVGTNLNVLIGGGVSGLVGRCRSHKLLDGLRGQQGTCGIPQNPDIFWLTGFRRGHASPQAVSESSGRYRIHIRRRSVLVATQ
jgi:hypothetical protein